MSAGAYSVTLSTVSADPSIHHLYQKLEYVESIQSTERLSNPNVMLRQLGKWAQEYFSPKRWKGAEKLIMEYDPEAGEICVFFGSRDRAQLTVRFDRQTSQEASGGTSSNGPDGNHTDDRPDTTGLLSDRGS